MHIVRMKFVLEFATPNGFAALAGARGIASLYHEPFEISVKRRSIIVSAGAEGEEIEGSSLCRVTVDFNFHVTEVGMECD